MASRLNEAARPAEDTACPVCEGTGATTLQPGRSLSGRSGAWGRVSYVNRTRRMLAVPCFRCGGSGAAFEPRRSDAFG